MRINVTISLGNNYFQQGKYEDAAVQYRKAVKSDPRHSLEAYKGLSEVYRKTGRLEKAIVVWQTALKSFQDNAEVYYNMGIIYQELEKIDDAISSFQEAVEFDPNDEIARCRLGILYFENGMVFESIKEFHTLILINPDNVDAYDRLGAALMKAGHFEKGREYLKKAIKIREKMGKRRF